MTGTNAIINLTVNGENTANGWTFTLNAGILDNDSFLISASQVTCKSGTTYGSRTYFIQVTATKSGVPTRVKTYSVIVTSAGAKGFVGALGSNATQYITYTNMAAITATQSRELSFNVFIPATFSSTVIRILTGNLQTPNVASASSLALNFFCAIVFGGANNGSFTSDFYKNNNTYGNTAANTVSATAILNSWNTVRIYFDGTTTTTFTLNGTLVYTTSTLGNRLQLPSYTESSALNAYITIAGTNANTFILSDLVYKENGVSVITSSYQTSVIGGTNTASITLGNIS